jgi:uncharacterized membrane protein
MRGFGRRPGGDGSRRETGRNVAGGERAVTAAAGLALALAGLRRRGVGGAALAAAGAALLARAYTGRCPASRALALDRARAPRSPVASVPHGGGIKIEHAVTVNRPAGELYRFWRRLENLPRFMEHLESVTLAGDGRSHWTAKGPFGTRVEWNADIVNDRENELIAWRSLKGADVGNAGSVQFHPAPGGRGTEVKVVLEYRRRGGLLGSALAKLSREDPERQVREDLRRFKQVMEAGEVPTTEGQPSGRERDGNAARSHHADRPIEPAR